MASGYYSSVAGGYGNIASEYDSGVSGGYTEYGQWNCCSVSGGFQHRERQQFECHRRI